MRQQVSVVTTTSIGQDTLEKFLEEFLKKHDDAVNAKLKELHDSGSCSKDFQIIPLVDTVAYITVIVYTLNVK